MLKLPSKYLRGQGVVYVATGTIRAGQMFIVEGDREVVIVKVSRRRKGCLRKHEVKFKKLTPLW